MARGEISWVREDQDGGKFQIYAQRERDRWSFHIRRKRYECWQALKQPRLEDWLELLDGVRRRVQRRLLRPEEVQRVEQSIRERFPEVEF